jgi:hypothetical protein
MTTLFASQTRLEAWLEASSYLLRAGPALNVILCVSSPHVEGAVGPKARARINAFCTSEDSDPLHTVAETIFPGWEYRHRGLRGVFENYGASYDAMKRSAPQTWGTYAHRLVSRRTAEGKVVNPLKDLIAKMKNELSQTNRGSYRSCYELGIAEGEYDLPLYNTVDDRQRRRNLPCLSHLSFKLFKDAVHLTAIYRSHDYRYKALGNLLGLARLQACVAYEVGIPIGSLVVHSTYAFVDPGRGKGAIRTLLHDLQRLVKEDDK